MTLDPALMLTRPLSVHEIARYFQVGRPKANAIIVHTPGVRAVAGKWQLPVVYMPESYWLDAGLVRPVTFPPV